MIPSTAERRKHRRFKFRGEVELSWTAADGKVCTTIGNCINLSLFGASVESPDCIPGGTQLELHAKNLSTSGPVTVTHCRPYGAWFRLGLRFAAPVDKSENFREATDIEPEVQSA